MRLLVIVSNKKFQFLGKFKNFLKNLVSVFFLLAIADNLRLARVDVNVKKLNNF